MHNYYLTLFFPCIMVVKAYLSPLHPPIKNPTPEQKRIKSFFGKNATFRTETLNLVHCTLIYI